MIWLTWRQFRLQALTAGLGVAAIALVAVLTGPALARLARSSTTVYDQLTSTDRTLFVAGIILVAAVPPLLGAFWGAPLVARELEAGTYRLVWTQSVSRARWGAIKGAATALAAGAAAGAVTLAVTWWSSPVDGAASSTRGALPGRLTPVTFAMRGIVPVSYAVFAVVLGVALGAVLRRSLPAMAVTLAVYVAVQVAVPLWVRPHLVAPVTASIVIAQPTLDGISRESSSGRIALTVHTANRDDWILTNETVDSQGRTTTLPAWFTDCLPQPGVDPGVAGPVRAQANDLSACLSRLADAGYRQRVAYQPSDRFWQLQWIESAAFLVASGLLTGLTFWLVRRRIS